MQCLLNNHLAEKHFRNLRRFIVPWIFNPHGSEGTHITIILRPRIVYLEMLGFQYISQSFWNVGAVAP